MNFNNRIHLTQNIISQHVNNIKMSVGHFAFFLSLQNLAIVLPSADLCLDQPHLQSWQPGGAFCSQALNVTCAKDLEVFASVPASLLNTRLLSTSHASTKEGAVCGREWDGERVKGDGDGG
jgi:hypothetical protein